jgi:RHS repeat-associated protein
MSTFTRSAWRAARRILQVTCAATAAAFLAMPLAHAQTAALSTRYTYDEAGNRTGQTDALGRTTRWSFDVVGRMTSRTIPSGSRESFSYGPESTLLAHTTFAGEVSSFQYDVMGRRTAQVVAPAIGSNHGVAGGGFAYVYTPMGLVQSRREQGPTTLNGLQTFRYDVNHRLQEAVNPIGRITYSTDPMGYVFERSVQNAGTARYDYDGAGRLTKVIAADGKQTRYFHDPAGLLIRIERELNPRGGQPQTLRTSFKYDAADRPVIIVNVLAIGSASTVLVGQQLTRHANGAIEEITTSRGDGSLSPDGTALTARVDAIQGFAYAELARLRLEVRTHSGGTTSTHYEYDAVGNRTKMSVRTGTTTDVTTYTYDVDDRLTRESLSLASGGVRVTDYAYDGNGNLARKTEPGRVTLYRFDPRNLLIDIRAGATLAQAQAAAPIVQYAYDGDGNRVRKGGANARDYLVDTNFAFAQVAREQSPSESVDYVRGIGLIRQTRATSHGKEDLFPLYGHQGTSLGAVNADGEVVEQIDVDAFGNPDVPTGLKQTHVYAGEYWDQDAQLLYLRARWYDPRIGRFISPDPFEGRQRDPRSLNRYVYAHSDPVHGTDPSGKMTAMDSGIAMGALTGLTVASVYWGLTQWQAAGVNGRLSPLTSLELKNGFPITAPIAASRARDAASTAVVPSQEDQHHTVPQYLCGNRTQWLYPIAHGRHMTLHGKLRTWQFAFNQAFKSELEKRDKPFSLENRDAFKLLAKTWYGRANVSNFVLEFYDMNGYEDIGASPQFKQESGLFVNARKIRPDCGPVIN